MKTLAIAIILASSATMALAGGRGGSSGHSGLSGTGSNPRSHYVAPHTNSNGTVTQGHYQTNPNNTQRDNYGTQGNVNPYTGAVGTKAPQN